MLKSFLTTALAVAFIGFPARGADEVDKSQVLKAQSKLGVALLKLSSDGTNASNITVSPSTLASALAVAALGASDDGRAAIADALGFEPGLKDVQASLSHVMRPLENEELSSAVAIVFEQRLALEPGAAALLKSNGIVPAFETLTASSSVTNINNWVKGATRGAIPTILDAPPGGAFVSLGALSFQGHWRNAFDPQSQVAAFRRGDGTSTPVRMMHLPAIDQRVRVDERFAAVDLSYADQRRHMVIVTARDSAGIKVSDVGELASFVSGEKFEPAKTEVLVPRFAATDSRDFRPMLGQLGLADQHLTSFPRFSRSSIALSHLLQKTVVQVDEKGTLAAAATAVTTERSIDPGFVRIVADSAFVFAVRDAETGLILAAGLVRDPGSGD